jgi:hypothetical protein
MAKKNAKVVVIVVRNSVRVFSFHFGTKPCHNQSYQDPFEDKVKEFTFCQQLHRM